MPIPYTHGSSSPASAELDAEEIAHFKREGYLVKRGLIFGTRSFARIIDYVWETVPRGALYRDDPVSWIDQPTERWPQEQARHIGALHGCNWKMRSPNHYGREVFLLEMSANHPQVRACVKQFIGPAIRSNSRVRGIYVVLPKAPSAEGSLGPHVDHAAAQLCAMVFIAQTPPRTGGFTIWPRSHTRLHPFWMSRYGAHFEPSLKQAFNAEHKNILETTTPIEFTGEPGDVVFWHPRLIHSAGVNYSAESNAPQIRYIVPCDFQRAGCTYYDDHHLGPGPKAQWWVDTRHFHEDPQPTSENMWDDWVI